MNWLITFDRNLENQVDTLGEFESWETAEKFLDELSYEELDELYNEWCNENGYLEDERMSSDECEIVIYEKIEFVPDVDVDTILDHIRDQASDFGGEYSEGYLERVSEAQLQELNYLLSDAFTRWQTNISMNLAFINMEKKKL
ncbi:hypothetical protein [Lysinibacillus pakistanensis]|uniref:Uncharacterized protein n=1 Tax=Lysinibacillus pakistanensis TaxID=759811 RepID=A0AAX3X5B7_9BACI|nr:hypothetical protein [Lysinibacillus pakistanensis]MDM5233449.1 hypothetical protein [Lysinibacillus pakistanensis]WHY48921.1 hypothetical protein QNH22_12070 [Lysinibacillus pakistanensis]WHY53932.1 hypothetical protein QNH24_12050 [Lysinibacillus pakistanensis]